MFYFINRSNEKMNERVFLGSRRMFWKTEKVKNTCSLLIRQDPVDPSTQYNLNNKGHQGSRRSIPNRTRTKDASHIRWNLNWVIKRWAEFHKVEVDYTYSRKIRNFWILFTHLHVIVKPIQIIPTISLFTSLPLHSNDWKSLIPKTEPELVWRHFPEGGALAWVLWHS